MSVVAPILLPTGMQAEWQRIEVLAQCLLCSRLNKEPEQAQLDALRQLQGKVERLRGRGDSANNPWHRLPVADLPPLALDILAAVYASEAQPRIGWLYQDLQTGIAQPYITPALLHLLFALDEGELHALQGYIGAEGELMRRNLIVAEGQTPFSPLHPEKGALATLMGWPEAELTLPGASRVKQQAHRDELILPADSERMLSEFLFWIKHQKRVVDEWGGKRVGGPIALFSGPSGTGKTFAASVIASELGWPLYRVDLGRLVSKYIGETEKNLGRLFDAAHGRNLVLQFDEVDALMSKRGEVKDARDRYANMEVSYLLARIEEHHGPCILTTNLRSQIDRAFSRRFQMVMEFPRPDEVARAELWRRMLPARAPLCEEVNLAFIATSVNMTGGNIRNAALHAAYLAADDHGVINMGHIATAVWRELAKERPQLNRRDLGALNEFLPTSIG